MENHALFPTSVKAVAYRLRETRRALGLTQAEVCRRTGIAKNTWNQWEHAISRPDIDKALMLCVSLGISLDWIYRGEAGQLPHAIAAALQNNPEIKD